MPLFSYLKVKCKTSTFSRYLESPEARAISGRCMQLKKTILNHKNL